MGGRINAWRHAADNGHAALAELLGNLPGGALSICCYPGHEEGVRELAALRDLAAGLDIRQFNALEARFANQREDSPKLFLIQRAP